MVLRNYSGAAFFPLNEEGGWKIEKDLISEPDFALLRYVLDIDAFLNGSWLATELLFSLGSRPKVRAPFTGYMTPLHHSISPSFLCL